MLSLLGPSLADRPHAGSVQDIEQVSIQTHSTYLYMFVICVCAMVKPFVLQSYVMAWGLQTVSQG